jgi:septal ring factor EnvC (AmiA/AmiB activator)
LVKAQNSAGTLGKDVANTFRDVIKHHQSDIEDFIFETKLLVANTTDAKLDVIDFYINDTLRAEIEEVKASREKLVADLQAGDIDGETFAMEMRDLASDLTEVAKTLGVIGDELRALSQDLAEDLQARAEQLNAGLQLWADEMASVGQAIADEMRNRGFSVPEIPAKPEIPDWSPMP